MAKTRAEIQKAYRERKKAEQGDEYLKKEARRTKTYYVPTTQLSTRKLRKRRTKIKNAMKNIRAREQGDRNKDRATDHPNVAVVNDPVNESAMMDDDNENGPCDSTSTSVVGKTKCTDRLTVKMNFPVRGQGRRKKSKSLKRAETKVRKLTQNLENARRKNSVLRQRLSRIDKHRVIQTNIASTEIDDTSIAPEDTTNQQSGSMTFTARSRSKLLLRASGLSPRRHKSIVKKLQLHESMVDDLKRTDSAINAVCGRTAKRSRQMFALSESLNVNRHKMLRKVRGPTNLQRRKMVEKARIKATVVQFMERDDNSSCLPGKSDCLKTTNGTKQKRVLNELLSSLHLKFRSENPDIKINASTFGSHRPKNIKLVHYSSRKTCLCQRHQNMALKVKGLCVLGITNVTTPDSYIKQATDEQLLSDIEKHDSINVKYTEWQRVEVEHKGRKIKRMQVVQLIKPKTEFIEVMRKEIPEFRSHCQRVKVQYEEVTRLKEKLPADQVIIQMDFAENYVCSHADEVQSAYFDKGSVTLHPTVIYHKNAENKLKHESHVIVSDTPMHNSGTVLAIIREIVPLARQLVTNLETIHYVTDSPTSQYRNKHMFYVVANHHNLFDGITASWQYFEAGHRKGPCDGVDGTAKRQADSAVKRQICSIQNADDFYAWGSSESHSNIKYMFVSNTKCSSALDDLKLLNIKPVKGTMSVHSVVSLGNNCIAIRNTSCFCDECFSDGLFHAKCNGWNKHTIESTVGSDAAPVNENDNHSIASLNTEVNTTIVAAQSSNNIASTEDGEHSAADDDVEQQHATNTYVAALYDEKWYIGKILEFDPDDNTYQIMFMTEGSNKRVVTFKWPEKEEILWLPNSSIMCAVDEPVTYGKTRRLYKLSEQDLKKF